MRADTIQARGGAGPGDWPAGARGSPAAPLAVANPLVSAEPALSVLVDRLALSDEETLAIFELEPLDAIAGEFEHRPEVGILDALTAEADERLGPGALARWVRAGRAPARPLDLLLAGDFGAFEDALVRRVGEAAA